MSEWCAYNDDLRLITPPGPLGSPEISPDFLI